MRNEEIVEAAKEYAPNSLALKIPTTIREYQKRDIEAAFIAGAKWADKTIIEKACKWLKDDMLKQNAFQGRLERLKIIENIITNFKKAMKGGEE